MNKGNKPRRNEDKFLAQGKGPNTRISNHNTLSIYQNIDPTNLINNDSRAENEQFQGYYQLLDWKGKNGLQKLDHRKRKQNQIKQAPKLLRGIEANHRNDALESPANGHMAPMQASSSGASSSSLTLKDFN